MDDPRHTETQIAYAEFKKQHEDNTELLQSFNFDNETILRKFTHWIIIKNRFPYDKMAKINDMLVCKRPIPSHYVGTQKEQQEYHTILQLLAKEGYYDALIENFPKVQSVKKFAHTHLVIWHNSDKTQNSCKTPPA